MIFDASLADESVAAKIHATLKAGYTVEAALLGCADFPPLRESLTDLQRSRDGVLAFHKDGTIVGVLTFSCDATCVRITRLVVHPNHVRQGIASALLVELERRFDTAACFTVSTARDNLPAIGLYERYGYATTSTTISGEGIALVHLTKFGSAR